MTINLSRLLREACEVNPDIAWNKTILALIDIAEAADRVAPRDDEFSDISCGHWHCKDDLSDCPLNALYAAVAPLRTSTSLTANRLSG